MKDKKCSKKFPKKFSKVTFVDQDNTYPEYRRRSPEDGGRTATIKRRGQIYNVDNTWVVPYSPYLCLRYNAHINVEICISPTASKYLFKYQTKGGDQAMVRTEVAGQCRDEIEDYVDLRSVGSSEAAWHLFTFPIAQKYPAVCALRIHLEDEQQISNEG